MIDKDVLAQVAANLAAIDTGEISARRAKADKEAAKLDAAIAEAERQIAELRERVRHYDGEDDGTRHAAAEALLTGADVMATVETKPRLEARIEAINVGLRGLRARRDGLANAKHRDRDEIRAGLGEAIEPLAELLEREAEETGARLRDLFANAAAVNACGANGTLLHFCDRLGKVVAELGESDFINRAPMAPDAELVAALAPAAEVMALGRCGVPDSIRFPDRSMDRGAFTAGFVAGQRPSKEAA